MKTNRILYAAALLLAACQTDNAQGEQAAPATKQTAGTVVGKPQAPVQIDADVGASSARVRVPFDQAGTNVEVRANGVDGLALLTDPVLVQDGACPRVRPPASKCRETDDRTTLQK